jgi:hypothetical protein
VFLCLANVTLQRGWKPVFGAGKHIGLFAIVAILTVSPWIIWNRLVLDAWVPVKSNLGYEALQSQVLDADGVLDSATLSRHPWVEKSELREQYAAKGEIAFVRQCWTRFLSSVSEDPLSYLERVMNRFVDACVLSPHTRSPILLSATFSIASAVCGLVLLCCMRWWAAPEAKVLVFLYIFSIVPHILFGYSERYGASLVMFRALTIIFVVTDIRFHIMKKMNNGIDEVRGKRPTPQAGILLKGTQTVGSPALWRVAAVRRTRTA